MIATYRKTLIALLLIASYFAHGQMTARPPSNAELRIQKETRHRLLILLYMGAFDNITHSVAGYTVTLAGQITRTTLRSDAANTVGRIEGVEVVNNQIEVLPISSAQRSTTVERCGSHKPCSMAHRAMSCAVAGRGFPASSYFFTMR